MSLALFIEALAIPEQARIDQRVPKKLLLEQATSTAADKRQIQDGIEELHWVAALKPANIGVAAYRDAEREYLEIAVLTVILRTVAKSSRVLELIHRAIPYPVLLLAVQDEQVSFSFGHKRGSQAEAGKTVIEELHSTAALNPKALLESERQFLASLALSTLPGADLFALYQGWIDRLTGLQAAAFNGVFVPPTSAEHAAELREQLANRARLQDELAKLHSQTAKEKQLNRRVELNMMIKKREAELSELNKTF